MGEVLICRSYENTDKTQSYSLLHIFQTRPVGQMGVLLGTDSGPWTLCLMCDSGEIVGGCCYCRTQSVG